MNKNTIKSEMKFHMDQDGSDVEKHIAGDIDVEAELKEAHRKIMLNSTRLKLLEDLLNMGLCTRDVYSFACTQADLCTTLEDLDWTTIRSAMKLKIRDLKQTLKDIHLRRRKLERELLQEFNGNSWKVIRKVKAIKKSLSREKKTLQEKYSKKKDHYKKTHERLINKDVNKGGSLKVLQKEVLQRYISVLVVKVLKAKFVGSTENNYEKIVLPGALLGLELAPILV